MRGGEAEVVVPSEQVADELLQPDEADLRARLGNLHPVEYMSRLNEDRVERFQLFNILVVQRAFRGLLGRRKCEDIRMRQLAATFLAARFRGGCEALFSAL